MHSYYSGRRAQGYNTRWRTFTAKTLAEVLAMIDFPALCHVQEQQGRPPRILDIACGTGVLLKQISERVPGAEAYGVDASNDMLAQARKVLQGQPQVQLQQQEIGGHAIANLPYAPASFDLITCTNAFHDMPEPVAVLAGLKRLLTSDGQLVIEDYARREPPFPWAIVEWLAKHLETGHVRAYTLAEARSLCSQAGLHVACEKTFVVNWLWHGWVLRASAAS
jgi:ubiquinone/menaquinone biosynthesis C-methylase UbiE